MANRLAWGVILMIAGVALMVGEFWLLAFFRPFAARAGWGGSISVPTVHRVLEWILIVYGAYLASPPVGRER